MLMIINKKQSKTFLEEYNWRDKTINFRILLNFD